MSSQTQLIVMLTHNDVTISEALERLPDVFASPAHAVGCKDLGIDEAALEQLIERSRTEGRQTFLEVVAESDASILEAADVASRLRPDFLIGGTLVEPVLHRLEGTGVAFLPYVGDVYDHPCRLRGEVEEIATAAEAAVAMGAAGVNLLSYRYDGDPVALTAAVRERISAPIVSAGSVDTPERLRQVAQLGVDYVTIGTALLEKRLAPGGSYREQIEASVKHLSEVPTK
jgi:hypothetical protein